LPAAATAIVAALAAAVATTPVPISAPVADMVARVVFVAVLMVPSRRRVARLVPGSHQSYEEDPPGSTGTPRFLEKVQSAGALRGRAFCG
jgi:hypothetical protein